MLFFFQALFLLSITFILFGMASNKIILFLVMLFFLLNQVATLFYGIVTDQIGFILMVVFQFFLTLMTFGYLNTNTIAIGIDDENK